MKRLDHPRESLSSDAEMRVSRTIDDVIFFILIQKSFLLETKFEK